MGPEEGRKGRGGKASGEPCGNARVTFSRLASGPEPAFARRRRRKRSSYQRRESFGGQGRHLEERPAEQGNLRSGHRNGVNPRVGSALQYTRRSSKEQAVEVVRNHGDGT
jgi:hypothetical protein